MSNPPQYVFNPPPNWPPNPPGWTPPTGWQPDPSWGPAPDGWQFWRLADGPPTTASPPPWAAPRESVQEQDAPPTMPAAAPVPATAVPPRAPLTQPSSPTLLPVDSADAGKSWFARHKVLSGVGGVFLFLMLVGAVSGGEDDAPKSADVNLASTDTDSPEEAAADKAAKEKAAAEKAAKDKAAAEKAAAEKAAKEKAAAEKAAKEKAAAEKAKIANAAPMTAREFALLVKNPDAYVGKIFRVFGEVTQFDAATGDDQFLARSGAAKDPIEYGYTDYDENTLFTGTAAQLATIVEGDVFSAVVEVTGTESYDTQIGGNTTVPKFKVLNIAAYGSTL